MQFNALILLVTFLFSSFLLILNIFNVNEPKKQPIETLKGYISNNSSKSNKSSDGNSLLTYPDLQSDKNICTKTGCGEDSNTKVEKYYMPCGKVKSSSLFTPYCLGVASGYDGTGCNFSCTTMTRIPQPTCCN